MSKIKRYNSEIGARESARDHGLYYGCDVFGGMWCVGTLAQLTTLGVWRIL
jgi:hypothetical protein